MQVALEGSTTQTLELWDEKGRPTSFGGCEIISSTLQVKTDTRCLSVIFSLHEVPLKYFEHQKLHYIDLKACIYFKNCANKIKLICLAKDKEVSNLIALIMLAVGIFWLKIPTSGCHKHG